MSDIEPATKVCTKCGEELSLTEFHKAGVRLHSWCKQCTNAANRARKEKVRAEIGDEAWREQQRQAVSRHRAKTGNVKGRAYSTARAMALEELRVRHQREFDYLLLLARRGELDTFGPIS